MTKMPFPEELGVEPLGFIDSTAVKAPGDSRTAIHSHTASLMSEVIKVPLRYSKVHAHYATILTGVARPTSISGMHRHYVYMHAAAIKKTMGCNYLFIADTPRILHIQCEDKSNDITYSSSKFLCS